MVISAADVRMDTRCTAAPPGVTKRPGGDGGAWRRNAHMGVDPRLLRGGHRLGEIRKLLVEEESKADEMPAPSPQATR